MSIEPPGAKQIPSPRTFHGDTFTDEFAWLADRSDPDTIAYLEAENAYAGAVTAALAPLRDQIFAEIKARPGAQGRLVALLPDGRGRAVPGLLPPRGPAR